MKREDEKQHVNRIVDESVDLNDWINDIEEYLKKQLVKVYDIELGSKMIEDTLTIAKFRAKEAQFEELIAKRFPAELINKCLESSKTFAVPGSLLSTIKAISVGSSVVSYFCPWKGARRKNTSMDCILEKLTDRGDSCQLKNDDNELTESRYFREKQGKVLGMRCMRNKRTFINPSLPFLSATPDGLLFSSVDKVIGVIEIKDLNVKDEAEYWEKGTTRKSWGIQIERDQPGGPIKERLRKGHCWSAQLYVQMITMRVTKGLLVLKVGEEWKEILIQIDTLKAQRMISNVRKQYTVILDEIIPDTLKIDLKPSNSKRGRPKMKNWIRSQQKIFSPEKFVTNLGVCSF